MDTDWIWGLGGGLLIGLGAALYLLGNGRIMGASGILAGLFGKGGRSMERLSFLSGLIMTPVALRPLLSPEPETHLTGNTAIVIIAGLLVGVGTRIANGCTSGHGVCGISRFSARGIVATLTYIGAGVATISLLRHAFGLI